MRSLSGIREANEAAVRQSTMEHKLCAARNDAAKSRRLLAELLAAYETGRVNDVLARIVRNHLEG